VEEIYDWGVQRDLERKPQALTIREKMRN
jgi:hypothetical protein